MPEELDFKQTLSVFYKDRNGMTKELRVKMAMEPGQIRLTFADIQMLAKQISTKLKEDA